MESRNCFWNNEQNWQFATNIILKLWWNARLDSAIKAQINKQINYIRVGKTWLYHHCFLLTANPWFSILRNDLPIKFVDLALNLFVIAIVIGGIVWFSANPTTKILGSHAWISIKRIARGKAFSKTSPTKIWGLVWCILSSICIRQDSSLNIRPYQPLPVDSIRA